MESSDYIVRKGTDTLKESFSAFGNPDLETYLKTNGINQVYTCGLTFDFCVGLTAIDSAKIGLETFVVTDATKSISETTAKEMIDLLNNNKVTQIRSEQVL